MGLIFLGYIMYKQFSQSIIFAPIDRINILVYGQYPAVYSLGLSDKVNYGMVFFADMKVMVPGGYGAYRVGGLGKLSALENNPQLLERAFASATSSFIDYYFITDDSTIYYGDNPGDSVTLPKIETLLTAKSNANLFDRLYITYQFLFKKRQHFAMLDLIVARHNNEWIFSEENFSKKYQGFFYRKPYRVEKENVQLIYGRSYSTAVNVSRIIEGNGIRVVDVSNIDGYERRPCRIIVREIKSMLTAKKLASIFNCPVISGKTETSDIIFELGLKEKDWEM